MIKLHDETQINFFPSIFFTRLTISTTVVAFLLWALSYILNSCAFLRFLASRCLFVNLVIFLTEAQLSPFAELPDCLVQERSYDFSFPNRRRTAPLSLSNFHDRCIAQFACSSFPVLFSWHFLPALSISEKIALRPKLARRRAPASLFILNFPFSLVKMSISYIGLCSLSQQAVPADQIFGFTRWFFLFQFGYRRLSVACALLFLNCLDYGICFISP